MFQDFQPVDPDPILGLMLAAFREDPNPKKTDLGVGVYRDEEGETPILASVLEAERRRLAAETTKTYIGPPGTPEFNVQSGRTRLIVSAATRSPPQPPGVDAPLTRPSFNTA